MQVTKDVLISIIVAFFFLVFLFSMAEEIKADPDFKVRCVLGQIVLIHKVSGNMIQLYKNGRSEKIIGKWQVLRDQDSHIIR
jgi:hypothetical protein